MTDLWWPPGYNRPAFQVQRQIYGTALGGDYVRGSAQFKGTLTGAGTALPSSPKDGDMWLLGSPTPTAAPTYDPPGPAGPVPAAPGHVIRWSTTPSAAWTNLGPITQTVGTALRYPRTSAAGSAIAGKSILHVRPRDHSTVEVQWGWPPAPNDSWLEVSLVRSAFGRPSTVNDGQTIFRALRAAFQEGALDPLTGEVADPPIVLDEKLPGGRWYHYGLFFKMTPVEWVRGMVDSCLLPRDLLHAAYMWDNVPPYYQWVDGNTAKSYLKPFLEIFGFELDQCREFVESWQHLYDADWSPIRLLRQLGPNFGVPYESGIGDIRYRSLMADIGHLYEIRGTEPSLTELTRNMSKYPCIVTGGPSMMLTPDDSDFYRGIGNWAGLHPETVIPSNVVLAPDHVKLAKAAPDEVVPPYGRGALKVWSSFADATSKLMVTVGDGLQYLDNTTDLSKGVEILPKQYGIPVDAGAVYGFSVSIKVSVPSLTAQPALLWFNQIGEPYQMLSVSLQSVGLGSISDTNWHDMYIEDVAPLGAVFAVPGVLFTSRLAGAGPTDSPYIYLAAAMTYYVGASASTLVVPPDRYLTMGDPGELIGGPDTAGHPAFTPFILGSSTAPPAVGGVTAGSGIFTDFFRQQLFANQTLMDTASVRIAYFSQAASFTDPYDPNYTGIRTLADLQAKPGWTTALTPHTVAQTLGTLTSGNSVYVLANNPFVNTTGWVDSPVVAAAFYINNTVGGVVNPIIFITTSPFSNTVMRPADKLTAAPATNISGNRSIFGWQKPAAGATQLFPSVGPLLLLKAPPNYEASHQEHSWLFPQRVNLLANPSFELGLNHWNTNGALTRGHPPLNALAWEGKVTGAGTAILKAPFWLKTGQQATSPSQPLDVPFLVKAKVNMSSITATADLVKHGMASPNFAWRVYFQGGALRLALSYDGLTEDTAIPPIFTTAELSAIAANNTDFYVGVEISAWRGLVAYQGITSTDGIAWRPATPQKNYDSHAADVHVSTGSYAVGGTNWQGKLYWASLEYHGLLWRFDAGSGYMKTFWGGPANEGWSLSAGAIDGTAGTALVLESNSFPTNLPDRSGLWTVQMLIRGTGRVRVGLLSWESSFTQTGADWGPDTDVWTLPVDGYLHLYAMRQVGEGSTGVVRIECDGPEFYVDELLCEPEWLPEWPYFDGDTTYGAMDDFSWYGGARGASYSLWYNHRRAVIGRLFAWDISDDDFTVTDEEVEAQGYVYKWVPAGVRVIPHMDVLWVGDTHSPVPAISGTVRPVKTSPTDALGVYPAWALPVD